MNGCKTNYCDCHDIEKISFNFHDLANSNLLTLQIIAKKYKLNYKKDIY